MFFNVGFHLRSFPLHVDWRKSDRSVDEEPQGKWRWNSNSRDAVASSPSFSNPAARAPRRASTRATESTAWNPESKTVWITWCDYLPFRPVYPGYQRLFMLGLEFRSSLYGDLCKALDICLWAIPNILLRARKKPFGTQGRLAIPFIHLFIMMGPCSILKANFCYSTQKFCRK